MPTILEDYFDFSDSREIRIQGHRVWMHDVLVEYVIRRLTLEELVLRFGTLTRDEILACLLYYHRDQAAMDLHLSEHLASWRQDQSEFERQHAAWLSDLRRRMTEHRDKLAAG